MSDSTQTPTDTTSIEPAPRKKTAWMVALGIMLALAIAAAGWAVLRDDGGSGSAPDGSDASDEATEAVESTRTVEDTSTVVVEPEGGDTNPEYNPNADPALVEQYTGIITGVKASDGGYVVTVDYVQFVTGDEAKRAAEARGGTVTEGGLYVVNDNPLIRERKVSPDITVRVTVDAAGQPSELGRTLPLAEWAAGFDSQYSSGTYIFTITNGTITMLEQLYMP